MQINIGTILKKLKAAVLGSAIAVVGIIAALTTYQRYESGKPLVPPPKDMIPPQARIKAELLGAPADLFAPAADALVRDFSNGLKVTLGTIRGNEMPAALVTAPAKEGTTGFEALVPLNGSCTPFKCDNVLVSTFVTGKNNQRVPATMAFSVNKENVAKGEYAAAFHVGGQEGAYFLNKFGAPTSEGLENLYSDISPADLSVATTASLGAKAVEAANKTFESSAQQGKMAQQQEQRVESIMGDRATVYQRVAKGSMPAKVVVKKTFAGEAFGTDGLTLQFELEAGKPLSVLDIGKAMLSSIHNKYRVDNFSKHSHDDQLRLTTAAGAAMVLEAMTGPAKDGLAPIGFGLVDVRGFDLNKAPQLLQQTLDAAPGIGKVQSEALESGRKYEKEVREKQEKAEQQRQMMLDRRDKEYKKRGLLNPERPFEGMSWDDLERGVKPGFR